MLDAIDGAATDIRRATSSLPDAIADIRRASKRPRTAHPGFGDQGRATGRARDKAVEAVAELRRRTGQLTLWAPSSGGADTGRCRTRIACCSRWPRLGDLERLRGPSTRHCSPRNRESAVGVGLHRHPPGQHRPWEARTRLNEAVRQIDAACQEDYTNITGPSHRQWGIDAGGAGSATGANNDVQASQRQYANQYGGGQSNMGAR